MSSWYRRDDSAVPPEFVLLPRDSDSEFADSEIWGRQERELLDVLRRAAAKVFPEHSDLRRSPFFQSATHQEVEAGALAMAAAQHTDHVLGWFREFDKQRPTDLWWFSLTRSISSLRWINLTSFSGFLSSSTNLLV